MNATLIANGINMNISNLKIFWGVLKTLKASGRAMNLLDYAVEKKVGEVDAGSIGSNF